MTSSNLFRLAGVMGMPIAQSRSPLIHNHWIQEHGIRGAYGHFPVQPSNIEAAVRGLSALGLAGCNITQPHKLAAFELMDWLSEPARRIGAINCIVVQPNGALQGFNFDGIGFIQSLRDQDATWRAQRGPIAVLGAGGAARAVLVSLIDEGATEIRLINRTRERAQELASISPVIKVFDWYDRHDALAGAALLVNSTNQGMYGQAPLDLRLDQLPRDAIVCDLIYVPLETQLLAAARIRGHIAVNGLGMLLNQAVPAFEAWFGVRPTITESLKSKIFATF